MTGSAWAVASALLVLAALDGAFAGFRSSAGRTGLIRHRRGDVVAAARGCRTVLLLLVPVLGGVLADVLGGAVLGGAVLGGDVLGGAARVAPYLRAGQVMLAVYLPYAAVVLAALAGHALLDWRRRFLATALVLGPGTLIRPVVVLAGAAAGAWAAHDVLVGALALLAAVAVLAVQPVADRCWYGPRRRSRPA
ncbi:oxidoreductase [Goodfellowiella coeruleoviolacea]|uniref:Uncharacterized protein n=1 Tax=Goodfellowiella coeruleoviolacea TaxID=334858 RepID=A0AAE3KIN8_9PSEU|nr:oxidoreductase [Goodfellowiella coeruleoviolacea]MCP2168187.1 hypothetical protein [Goodfellowiella coeruleoviolacea]